MIYDIWIISIASLVGIACGVLGCFLILKKQALMADAISHSVLPGIVLAVIWTGRVNSIGVLIGASILGFLTPLCTHWLQSSGQLKEDSAMGIVFTSLFALGIVWIGFAGNVDIDPDCILYGEIATTPLDTYTISWLPFDIVLHIPRAFLILLAVAIGNILILAIFYKELQITTFDPVLANAMGFSSKTMQHILMGMVTVTTVAAFESVGAILVVAMFIAPGATAYLCTNRLHIMLVAAGLLGIASATLGYMATQIWDGDVSIAGCISVIAGILFLLALLVSPTHGIFFKIWQRFQMYKKFQRDHLIMELYRYKENGQTSVPIQDVVQISHEKITLATIRQSVQQSWIEIIQDNIQLTEHGIQAAKQLIQAHRLWETYLHKLGLPNDHLHRPASDMEHFLTPDICQDVQNDLGHPKYNPEGKEIPQI